MPKLLKRSNVELKKVSEAIRRLNILLDFDQGGYLLQIFPKPVLDWPALFLEVTQRNHFEGFGAGNFKSLFAAVEREQAERGHLLGRVSLGLVFKWGTIASTHQSVL